MNSENFAQREESFWTLLEPYLFPPHRISIAIKEVQEILSYVDEAAGGWGRIPIEDRAAAFRRMAGLLREDARAHATLVSREMGKPILQATAEIERDLIQQALDETGGNVTHAARRLKISRKSLQIKMKELGLRDPPEEPAEPSSES